LRTGSILPISHGLLNVHEFHSEGAAIGFPEDIPDFTKSRLIFNETRNAEFSGEISFGQAEHFQTEQWMVDPAG
jgi:hypothetical protein